MLVMLVGLLCFVDPIRLTESCSGAVEVYLGGVLGAVCYDGWDYLDASVVCKELDCKYALLVNSTSIQEPVLMSNINCNGSESSLMNCRRSGKNCSSNLQATVTCGCEYICCLISFTTDGLSHTATAVK